MDQKNIGYDGRWDGTYHSRHHVRTLLLIFDIVVIMLIILSTIGILFVQNSLPKTHGTLILPGVHAIVHVERDRWGVAYINASNMHDLLFVQGYTTAQDRLFQMEMSRRIIEGQLAQTFGTGSNNEFVQADILLRTIGIYPAIQDQVSHLDVATEAEFQAYTDGVNAFITAHRQSLPLEFTILGIPMASWTIADSVAVEAEIVLALDTSWYYKYTRAIILASIGPSLTSLLFPPYPVQYPTLFSSEGNASQAPSLQEKSQSVFALSDTTVSAFTVLHTLLGNIGGTFGSNNWVVDGTKTTTGKPMLANDPHLSIAVPSTWYEVALRTRNLNVIGFSLPGVPGVVIGHNASIAWGMTDVGADTTDLYKEKLDPTNHPGQYFYNQQWVPLLLRQEKVRVRGENKPIVLTIATTNNGPLLNYAVDDLKHYVPVALKWTLLQSQYQIANFVQLDTATDWSSFKSALDGISICLNFVYADIQGNIGYRMSGLLPLRLADNRLLPVDGSTAAHNWWGYVPQSHMPTLFDPPSHMIVTANNRIVSDKYSIYVATDWDDGYRAQRITDLLVTTRLLSVSDFERIQADVYSLPATKLVPLFLAAGRSTPDSTTKVAVKVLSDWNDTLTRESAGGAVYELAVSQLFYHIVEPLLGSQLYKLYQSNYSDSGFFTFLINSVTTPNAEIFPDKMGQESPVARRNILIVDALHAAIQQLQTQEGGEPAAWRWGKLHQATFAHPLATVFPFNFLFGNTQLQRPGDDETVNVGGDDNFTDFPANYNQQTISSMREIIDLGNFDNSLWIITTGESGQPFSNHYNDLNPLWDQNYYQVMVFSDQQQADSRRNMLILRPGSL